MDLPRVAVFVGGVAGRGCCGWPPGDLNLAGLNDHPLDGVGTNVRVSALHPAEGPSAKSSGRDSSRPPQISVNGPAEFTDASRGKGAFKTVMRAMDNRREAGCVFAELAI